MRLVDADVAVRLLRSIGSRDYRREKGTIADAIKMLSHPAYTPTIEAEPVKHGRWELRHVGHGHYWECSNCHTNPCIYVTKDTNYCPNCGAKMDLEGEG